MLKYVAFMLCMSSSAWAAGALYINGVRVDGLANLQLKNVDLEIDAKGDLHVTAKGYQVNVSDAPTTPKPVTPPPRNAVQPTRYYLTLGQSGDPQWDIDVYLNNQLVRRFTAGQALAPIDVTRMIRPNENNSVRFHAVKQEGQVRSVQPSEYLQITLDADAALVTGRHELTHVYSYRRTAAETGLFDDSVSVSIR